MFLKPGLASSEEKRPLRKIILSGDLSLNPASSKKTPRAFRIKRFPDSSKYVTEILHLDEAPSIKDEL